MQRCVCVAKFLAEVISDLYEICACYLSTGVLLLDFDNTKSPDVLKKKKNPAKHTQISSYGLKSNWCLLKLNHILM